MRFRTIICTALLALTFSVTAFGAEHTAQVVSFGHSVDTDAAIELTGSKVITDDFSFKMPDGWSGNCVMVADGSSYEIYNKTAYEEDGSGLLFSIICYEDVDYQDLKGCSILGFYGNKTYILESSVREAQAPETISMKNKKLEANLYMAISKVFSGILRGMRRERMKRCRLF